MEHTKHVFRVLIALVALIVTYILVRGFFVPKSFGKYGAYRYDNVPEQRDKPLVHGAVEACQGCHSAVWDKRAKGKHATVPCEDCHAPLATHAAAGKRIAPMAKDPSYQLCVRCHRKLASRPAAVIKQVVPEDHVTNQGEKLTGNVCVGCHDVHSPQMGDDKADEGTPKADTPKADTPKADTPKADTPKADTPKADTPKADTPKGKATEKGAGAEGGSK